MLKEKKRKKKYIYSQIENKKQYKRKYEKKKL